jgi:RNA polymerase sigma-70 factor (ECF subfamily)
MSEPPRTAASPGFRTTRWSLVLDAGAAGSGAALEELCAAYWLPLYAFARRRGSAPADAEDLVQGFFAALIEKRHLADADRDRGRFRAFLLTSFKHFASKEREKASAKKRGGGRPVLSLDFEHGERVLRLEPADGRTPEATFERRYALALIDRAFDRLAVRYRSGGPEKADRHDALAPLLTGGPAQPYREIGERLGLTETAVKVAVHRMRQHYKEALRAEIADTVGDPSEVDDEIRRLMEAVSR